MAWKSQNVFSISGLDRKTHLTRVTLRFKSEDAAKVASALLNSLIQEEQGLDSKKGEMAVEILATARIGPYLLFMILFPVALFAEIVLRVSEDVRFAVSIIGLAGFTVATIRAMDARIRAGPAVAWFRPRRVKAWMSVDEDSLNVRTWESTEALTPTRIEWSGTDSFVVSSGRTQLQALFATADQASEMLRSIQVGFPRVEVKTRY